MKSYFSFQEKVTDYAEEKEIVTASTALLDDAIASVRKFRITSKFEILNSDSARDVIRV